MKYRTLVYRIPCPSLTAVSESNTSDVNGKITRAFIHIPRNTASLAEVEIWLKTKKIFPSTRMGMVGDDIKEWFNIDEPVSNNDTIEVVVKNHDDTYSHTIVVAIELEEEE